MKIVNLVPECRSRTDRQNREENLLSVWTRGHWTWAIVHRTRPNHRFQNLRVNLRNSTLHSCQNPKPKKEKKKKKKPFNSTPMTKPKQRAKKKRRTEQTSNASLAIEKLLELGFGGRGRRGRTLFLHSKKVKLNGCLCHNFSNFFFFLWVNVGVW